MGKERRGKRREEGIRGQKWEERKGKEERGWGKGGRVEDDRGWVGKKISYHNVFGYFPSSTYSSGGGSGGRLSYQG